MKMNNIRLCLFGTCYIQYVIYIFEHAGQRSASILYSVMHVSCSGVVTLHKNMQFFFSPVALKHVVQLVEVNFILVRQLHVFQSDAYVVIFILRTFFSLVPFYVLNKVVDLVYGSSDILTPTTYLVNVFYVHPINIFFSNQSLILVCGNGGILTPTTKGQYIL